MSSSSVETAAGPCSDVAEWATRSGRDGTPCGHSKPAMVAASTRAERAAAGAEVWPTGRMIDLDRRWNRKVSTRLSRVAEIQITCGWSGRQMTFSGAPASSEIEFPPATFTLVNKFKPQAGSL